MPQILEKMDNPELPVFRRRETSLPHAGKSRRISAVRTELERGGLQSKVLSRVGQGAGGGKHNQAELEVRKERPVYQDL